MRGRIVLIILAVALAAEPAVGFDWIGKIELEAEGLEDTDADKRLQAVQRLAQYSDAVGLIKPHLLGALHDPDVKVRAAAGRVLGTLGVTEALPIVIEWLNSGERQLRVDASQILGALGDRRAIKPLIRSLGDPAHEVRHAAVNALGKLAGAEVVVPLIARLEDAKADVRRAATEQLAKLGDRRALIPLVGAMSDSSIDVRLAAIRAVGELGDTSAVPALMRLLRDPVEGIKVAAISALGSLEATEATGRLIDSLGTGSDDFRARAAFALGQIAKGGADKGATRRAIRALVTTLSQPRSRQAAREALLAAGSVAIPGIIDHLRGELPGHPATAIMLLRDIGDPSATPALLAELDRRRLSRELVLEALGKAGDTRALVPVLTLLSDADAAVRLAAMRALEPMLVTGSQAADVLVDMLADRSPEIRRLAIDYLGVIRARAASRPLALLAKGAADNDLRVAALDALAEIGDPAVTGDLLDLLEAGSLPIRRAAATAISRIAEPSSADRLLEMLESRRGDPPLVARTLGGVLRDRDHEGARKKLLELAARGRLKTSVAGLAALAAMSASASESGLRDLLGARSIDRRRGAIEALGNFGGPGAADAIARLLEAEDDRVSSAAALALGKLGATAASAALERATRRRGFATPVNAAAALLMLADKVAVKDWDRLLHHPRRLVRANAALAVARSKQANLVPELEYLLTRDPSWVVRVNAARALSQLGVGKEAIERAAKRDGREEVREAAEAARAGAFAAPPRDQWILFYFVDPTSSDDPVEQEPYFVIGADGLVSATYSDVRGEAAEEQFTAGDYVIAPMAAESEH